MEKTFTLNNLILFTYGELSKDEEKEMSHTIENDEWLKKEYLSLNKAKQILDNSDENPSDRVISNILNLSKSLNVLKSNGLRNVEYIAN